MNTKPFKWLLLAIVTLPLGYGTGFAQSKTTHSKINTSQDLAAGRVKIDSLDNLVIKILGEREKIVKEIGVYKAKNHIPPLQQGRFKEVVQKSIAAGHKVGLSPEFIMELLNAVHKESLRIENDKTILKH